MTENGQNPTGTDLVEQSPEAAMKELVPVNLEPPKNIAEPEVEAAREAALVLVERIKADPSDRSALREAAAVGDDIQTKANGEFGLMRTSLGKVMDRMSSGEKNSIPQDLVKLRDVMDQINPYPAIEQMKKSQTAGFFSRLLKGVPGVGKVLSDIAMRYESVQTQVDSIIQSLLAGSDKLLENSLEIEERYNNLKQLQGELKLRGYKLQVLLKELENARSEISDEAEKQALQKAMVRVVRRLQNIKVTENAFSQFFVTMNITMDNHDNLRDSIKSMVNLTRPVLENGLALKIAQQDEKEIAQALSASQQYLGNLMVSIAEDSMDNAAEVAKVTNEPLMRFQDLIKSYNILTSRMEEASKIEGQMLESAKSNMAQLEDMTKDLEKRAQAQEAARDTLNSLD